MIRSQRVPLSGRSIKLLLALFEQVRTQHIAPYVIQGMTRADYDHLVKHALPRFTTVMGQDFLVDRTGDNRMIFGSFDPQNYWRVIHEPPKNPCGEEPVYVTLLGERDALERDLFKLKLVLDQPVSESR